MLLDIIISPPLNAGPQIEISLLKITGNALWHDVDEANLVVLGQEQVKRQEGALWSRRQVLHICRCLEWQWI